MAMKYSVTFPRIFYSKHATAQAFWACYYMLIVYVIIMVYLNYLKHFNRDQLSLCLINGYCMLFVWNYLVFCVASIHIFMRFTRRFCCCVFVIVVALGFVRSVQYFSFRFVIRIVLNRHLYENESCVWNASSDLWC